MTARWSDSWTTWVTEHCYHCGERYPEAAIPLAHKAARGELTEAEQAKLDELTADHEGCFA
jgi:hypothetical protein